MALQNSTSSPVTVPSTSIEPNGDRVSVTPQFKRPRSMTRLSVPTEAEWSAPPEPVASGAPAWAATGGVEVGVGEATALGVAVAAVGVVVADSVAGAAVGTGVWVRCAEVRMVVAVVGGVVAVGVDDAAGAPAVGIGSGVVVGSGPPPGLQTTASASTSS